MNFILPVVGSSGFYELASPFDALAMDRVEYTCKGVRRLSDYLANNEDPKTDIYVKNAIEPIYEEDLKLDAYIVSLQSISGHWLYVPYRYILSYPSPNGVKYRTVMLGVALPALPVSQALNGLMADVKDLVEGALGVDAVIKMVETSKPVLVSTEADQEAQLRRGLKISAAGTLHTQNQQLRDENAHLRAHITQLQDFIKSNAP
jgi:hypothetical protein